MNKRSVLARMAVSSVGLIAWGLALYGVLRVASLKGQWQHGICGPWGCGPPTQTLVACHGFWVVLIFPLMIALIRRASATTLHRLGMILTLAGVVALVGIAGREWTQWYLEVSESLRGFFLQRYLFSIATLVDVPVVEMTLVGLGCLIAAAAKGLLRCKAGSAAQSSRPADIAPERDTAVLKG